MKKIILAAAILFTVNFATAQATDEAYKKEVLKVIHASGAAGQMQAAKDQILPMIPAAKQAAFLVEFEATMPALYDKIVKVYTDNYTKEDIKAMAEFYNSPVGKKISAKSVDVAKASMAAGQEWGAQLQPLMMKYMQ